MSGIDIEIDVLIGGFENVIDPASGVAVLRGLETGEWGADSTGPYFDPDGAAAGEHAFLSIDAAGVTIEPLGASGLQLEAPDGRRFVPVLAPRTERVYEHDESGRLFTGSLLVPARHYPRRPDGRLFPHAPTHAGR